jgi:hypothetical protein
MTVCTVAIVCPLAMAEEDAHEGHGEFFHRHKVGITFGFTYVSKAVESDEGETAEEATGVWAPTIGVDYKYRLDHKWALVGAAEIELIDYEIHGEDLSREKALIVAGLVSYEVMPSWGVFAGGGIEIEEHHSLAVVRAGTEYEFEIGEQGWVIAPVFFYDFKEEYDAFSLSVALGKWF